MALRIFLKALFCPRKYRLCGFQLDDGSLFWGCLTDKVWKEIVSQQET